MTEKVFQVDTYQGAETPDAAKFGVGVSDLAGAQQAADARRAVSERLSNGPESIDRDLQYRPR